MQQEEENLRILINAQRLDFQNRNTTRAFDPIKLSRYNVSKERGSRVFTTPYPFSFGRKVCRNFVGKLDPRSWIKLRRNLSYAHSRVSSKLRNGYRDSWLKETFYRNISESNVTGKRKDRFDGCKSCDKSCRVKDSRNLQDRGVSLGLFLRQSPWFFWTLVTVPLEENIETRRPAMEKSAKKRIVEAVFPDRSRASPY